ncbi:MAG: tRNA lysidine(34) synthetase TilS [Bacteroidia bacterium]|jgi:tRNA(Ile)-lysidine synthase|nr:tRNA lysidine(34) synthetase TilS [Bacteroidia bacterium]
MELRQVFENYFKLNPLHHGDSVKLLLGVSGGIDSMVLLDLCNHFFRDKIGVAHINYQLRGNDSLADELLVEKICTENNIPLFTKRVIHDDTFGLGLSGLQDKARQIRYAHFTAIQQDFGYNYVLTAHHQEDVAETLLLKLARGTGLRGAKGILSENQNIIRPLLSATKSMIEAYAINNHIQYRNDASNNSLKYDRNKVRQQIMPLLKDINAKANAHLFAFTQFIKNSEQILGDYFALLSSQAKRPYYHGFIFDISLLNPKHDLSFQLFYLLNDSHLTSTQYANIADAVRHQRSGAIFYTAAFQYGVHKNIIIQLPNISTPKAISIHLENDYYEIPYGGKQIIFTKKSGRPETFDLDTIYFDDSKINSALQIRTWEKGDHFYPLGLKGKSIQVGVYLNQKSIPTIVKPWIPLILSLSDIIAVGDLAVSYHYRLTEQTTCYWELKIL